MAKWKILHVIGGEISLWRAGQVRSQYQLLPAEIFEQEVACGEVRTARLMENLLLRPVKRLGRHLAIERTAAGNLQKLVRSYDPDLVVCWDIPATQQLRVAALGRRRQLAAVAMLFHFEKDPVLTSKLVSNYHNLGLHLVCSSDRLCQLVAANLAVHQRVYRIYPAFEKSSENTNKQALRLQMGLDADAIPVFLPTEGAIEDVYNGIIACGIVERVEHRLRIVIGGYNSERAEQCRSFARRTIVVPMMHVIDDWDIRSVVSVCDVAVQPMRILVESLGLLEAMGRSVPVITNTPAEPAELFIPGRTFWDAGKTTSRAFATGIYKLISDAELRGKLNEEARQIVQQKCSEVEYRAAIVKLYQQMLEARLRLT